MPKLQLNEKGNANIVLLSLSGFLPSFICQHLYFMAVFQPVSDGYSSAVLNSNK